MLKHEVQPGDCILQIAESHGHFWETLWDHPDNSKLKELRKDPNVLAPGDVVAVPDIVTKEESAAVEKRHRYKRKGVPGKIKIRMTLDGKPRANLRYVLTIDGVSKSGTTDADGFIEMDIPAGAIEGELKIEEDGRNDIYRLDLGHLDPVDTAEGMCQRIEQMGYSVEEQKDAPDEPPAEGGSPADNKSRPKTINQLDDKSFIDVVKQTLKNFDADAGKPPETSPLVVGALVKAASKALAPEDAKESSSASQPENPPPAGEAEPPQPQSSPLGDMVRRIMSKKDAQPDEAKQLVEKLKKAFGQ